MITLADFRSTQSPLADPKPASAPARTAPAVPIRTHGAPVAILGVPFDNVTTAEAIALIDRMVSSGRPHYLATANVDFLVQAVHDVELRRILFEAHLVLCDGTPLLWASRWLGNPLPERVAGSDLVPLLIRLAAERAYRLFFLGGSPEATREAVTKLQIQYPDLVIAGHYSPPFQRLLDMDHAEIRRRIDAAKPDLLFVSFGCPKQEKWIAMHYRSLQVPVSIGVGGTIDFLAGRLTRAPAWMQQTGTEWIYRLLQEPRRLFKRYAKDLCYFGGLLMAQWCRMELRSGKRPSHPRPVVLNQVESCQEIELPDWLDAETVHQEAEVWGKALGQNGHWLAHAAKVQFIDSTGVGLLIRMRKQAGAQNRHFILVAPSTAVRRSLEAMRLWPFFLTARDTAHARCILAQMASMRPALIKPSSFGTGPTLTWQGEITAANADEVWKTTGEFISAQAGTPAKLTIDLSSVSFIDSTALGLMVRTKKHASTLGAQLRFSAVQPNVRNVIRLSKLEPYLLGGSG